MIFDQKVLRRANAQRRAQNLHISRPVAFNADNGLFDNGILATPAYWLVQEAMHGGHLAWARTRLTQISIAYQVCDLA